MEGQPNSNQEIDSVLNPQDTLLEVRLRDAFEMDDDERVEEEEKIFLEYQDELKKLIESGSEIFEEDTGFDNFKTYLEEKQWEKIKEKIEQFTKCILFACYHELEKHEEESKEKKDCQDRIKDQLFPVNSESLEDKINQFMQRASAKSAKKAEVLRKQMELHKDGKKVSQKKIIDLHEFANLCKEPSEKEAFTLLLEEFENLVNLKHQEIENSQLVKSLISTGSQDRPLLSPPEEKKERSPMQGAMSTSFTNQQDFSPSKFSTQTKAEKFIEQGQKVAEVLPLLQDKLQGGGFTIEDFMSVQNNFVLQDKVSQLLKEFESCYSLSGRLLCLIMFEMIKSKMNFKDLVYKIHKIRKNGEQKVFLTPAILFNYLMKHCTSDLKTALCISCGQFMGLPLLSWDFWAEYSKNQWPPRLVWKEMIYIHEVETSVLQLTFSNAEFSTPQSTWFMNGLFLTDFEEGQKNNMLSNGVAEIQYDLDFQNIHYIGVANLHGQINIEEAKQLIPIFDKVVIHISDFDTQSMSQMLGLSKHLLVVHTSHLDSIEWVEKEATLKIPKESDQQTKDEIIESCFTNVFEAMIANKGNPDPLMRVKNKQKLFDFLKSQCDECMREEYYLKNLNKILEISQEEEFSFKETFPMNEYTNKMSAIALELNSHTLTQEQRDKRKQEVKVLDVKRERHAKDPDQLSKLMCIFLDQVTDNYNNGSSYFLINAIRQIRGLNFNYEHLPRELYLLSQKERKLYKDQTFKLIKNTLLQGNPVELIDGDNLLFNSFIKDLFSEIQDSHEDLLVIAAIGEQSSGKSLILNSIFGGSFVSTTARGTKGIYCQLVRLQTQDGKRKNILILDTEGINSGEVDGQRNREDFTKKMYYFILCMSHVVLVCTSSGISGSTNNAITLACEAILETQQQILFNPSVYFLATKVSPIQHEQMVGQLNQAKTYYDDKCKNLSSNQEKKTKLIKITGDQLVQIPMAFSPKDKVINGELRTRKVFSIQFQKEILGLKNKMLSKFMEVESNQTSKYSLSTWASDAEKHWEFTNSFQLLVQYDSIDQKEILVELNAIESRLIKDFFENGEYYQKLQQQLEQKVEELRKELRENHLQFIDWSKRVEEGVKAIYTEHTTQLVKQFEDECKDKNLMKDRNKNLIQPIVNNLEIQRQNQQNNFLSQQRADVYKQISDQAKEKGNESLDKEAQKRINDNLTEQQAIDLFENEVFPQAINDIKSVLLKDEEIEATEKLGVYHYFKDHGQDLNLLDDILKTLLNNEEAKQETTEDEAVLTIVKDRLAESSFYHPQNNFQDVVETRNFCFFKNKKFLQLSKLFSTVQVVKKVNFITFEQMKSFFLSIFSRFGAILKKLESIYQDEDGDVIVPNKKQMLAEFNKCMSLVGMNLKIPEGETTPDLYQYLNERENWFYVKMQKATNEKIELFKTFVGEQEDTKWGEKFEEWKAQQMIHKNEISWSEAPKHFLSDEGWEVKIQRDPQEDQSHIQENIKNYLVKILQDDGYQILEMKINQSITKEFSKLVDWDLIILEVLAIVGRYQHNERTKGQVVSNSLEDSMTPEIFKKIIGEIESYLMEIETKELKTIGLKFSDQQRRFIFNIAQGLVIKYRIQRSKIINELPLNDLKEQKENEKDKFVQKLICKDDKQDEKEAQIKISIALEKQKDKRIQEGKKEIEKLNILVGETRRSFVKLMEDSHLNDRAVEYFSNPQQAIEKHFKEEFKQKLAPDLQKVWEKFKKDWQNDLLEIQSFFVDFRDNLNKQLPQRTAANLFQSKNKLQKISAACFQQASFEYFSRVIFGTWSNNKKIRISKDIILEEANGIQLPFQIKGSLPVLVQKTMGTKSQSLGRISTLEIYIQTCIERIEAELQEITSQVNFREEDELKVIRSKHIQTWDKYRECDQFCPTCGRPCDSRHLFHLNQHDCSKGHFMQCFKGCHYDDKKAMTIPCHQMYDEFEFDDKKQWTQIKDNDWVYKANSSDFEEQKEIWKQIGPKICRRQKITYQDCILRGKTHKIFLLQKTKENLSLIQDNKQLFEDLHQKGVVVSIVVFSDRAEIICKFEKPLIAWKICEGSQASKSKISFLKPGLFQAKEICEENQQFDLIHIQLASDGKESFGGFSMMLEFGYSLLGLGGLEKALNFDPELKSRVLFSAVATGDQPDKEHLMYICQMFGGEMVQAINEVKLDMFIPKGVDNNKW